jgi:hypothetical protein
MFNSAFFVQNLGDYFFILPWHFSVLIFNCWFYYIIFNWTGYFGKLHFFAGNPAGIEAAI